MENLDPPPPPALPPHIKDGKMALFCPSRGLILDLGGWGFDVPFYFAQDCSFKRRFAFGKFPGVNVLRFLPKYMF